MELRDFDNDSRIALVGVLETVKDEFSFLDEDSEMVFDEIYDELGKEEYDKLVTEFAARFKNVDEFKYFLLSLDNAEVMEIIHDYAIGITPLELDAEYTIVDFLEDNFSYLFGAPDPELSKEEKFLFLSWLDYLNLLPSAAYDSESEEYMLDLWVDIDAAEFDEIYATLPNKMDLSVDEFEDNLKELSEKVTNQEVRNFMFETMVYFADFDFEDDMKNYPQISWLEKAWDIQFPEE